MRTQDESLWEETALTASPCIWDSSTKYGNLYNPTDILGPKTNKKHQALFEKSSFLCLILYFTGYCY